MRRTLSLAGGLFKLRVKLTRYLIRKRFPGKLIARITGRTIGFLLRHIGNDEFVDTDLFGRSLLMPVSHFLPTTMAEFPQYNSPLVLAVEALSMGKLQTPSLVVIDVGANIGDTAAIIEYHHPGICSYFCIEPDPSLASICRENHATNPNVIVEQAFIGEDSDISVRLIDDGRANPSTQILSEPSSGKDMSALGRLTRLDSIALDFCKRNGRVDLIKIDTEGFDYSIIRSASRILDEYGPAIYFEWYPKLLAGLGENITGPFGFLRGYGYKHFLFFNELGYYHCAADEPSELFLRGLASIAMSSILPNYFDVFACAQESLRDRLLELSIDALGSNFSRFDMR
jgi:FkbM family methyltransferase